MSYIVILLSFQTISSINYAVTQNSIKIKRAITWQSFQPRAEFNPGVEISTLLRLAGLKFQPWVELSPGLKILSCSRFNPGLKLFMSNWSMRSSDYLLQETKWRIRQHGRYMTTRKKAFQPRG